MLAPSKTASLVTVALLKLLQNPESKLFLCDEKWAVWVLIPCNIYILAVGAVIFNTSAELLFRCLIHSTGGSQPQRLWVKTRYFCKQLAGPPKLFSKQ